MLYRTILLMSVVWILVTGIVLALLVTLSWWNVQGLVPLSRHLAYIVEIDSVHDALEERFRPQHGVTAQDRPFIGESADALEGLVQDERAISEQSNGYLRTAAAALRTAQMASLDATSDDTAPPLAEALVLLRDALGAARAAHRDALGELAARGERQLQATLVLAAMIPVATLAFLVFFRRRVLAPLNDLGYLIGLLSRKDYAAAMIDNVDPLMAPLFEKYNRMVRRMRDLDLGHSKREDALQQDVEQATRALIQQQLALAHADRMAAVGDLSARLAHDLRNPVSGVMVALANLRGEVESAEHSERLGLAIRELERVARLFNGLLEESRQVPERPERLQISRVVNDLVKLLRYQLDAGITVKTRIPEDIFCRLPEAGFRHVLLNLVTNAAQAIGKGPGTIEVTAGLDDGHVAISISDDGPGFPIELLRAGVHEHGSWRVDGAGIGLATARRFALTHASRLELRNREGGGAVAILTLPVEDCDT